MTQRIDYQKLSTPGLRALGGVYTYIVNSGLPKALIGMARSGRHLHRQGEGRPAMGRSRHADFGDPCTRRGLRRGVGPVPAQGNLRPHPRDRRDQYLQPPLDRFSPPARRRTGGLEHSSLGARHSSGAICFGIDKDARLESRAPSNASRPWRSAPARRPDCAPCRQR
jgi:hypothetical protein